VANERMRLAEVPKTALRHAETRRCGQKRRRGSEAVSANRITVAEWRRMARGKPKKPRVKRPPPVITWRVSTSPGRVVVRIDGLRLVSELNMHEHWRSRLNRSRAQKEIIGNAILGVNFWHWVERPVRVTIWRIAPRRLDPTENAPSSAKWTIDRLAEAFGVNDRNDAAVKYTVDQKRAEPKQYGVEIVIESAEERKAV
jgi:hypothetical protein